MIKHFLNLEWKQFFRSASFGKGLALKILMIFFALYFIVMFSVMGFFMYDILQKTHPKEDPFIVFNGIIFFWILGDLMVRFFLQKLPVMSVKPLLTLPIKRRTVVNFVLGKSALSFFNFLPLFAIVPFGLKLIANDYSTSAILVWMLTIVILTLINNFLNFIIESISSETEFSFLPIVVFVSALFALNYFDIINIEESMSSGVLAITENPVFILIPIAVLLIIYTFNFKILRQKLFLDNSLKTKVQEVKTSDLSWTKRFGDIAPFLQLDLKLIWRNKRSKSSAFLMALGLLYGLFFYPQPIYQDKEIIFVLVGIFSTGIFLINFGQFIPAWDSSYYKLLMSQNIPYYQYLKSKHTLMTLSVVLLFVLGIPYVYFGWKILVVHLAAAIYNIGVNSHVILFGGSLNRKKIDLDQRAAFNFQGTGAVQWLLGIPLMLMPMAIFGLILWLVNFEIAVLALATLGVVGIVFHQHIMKRIVQKYLTSKYKMIDAFSQDN